MIKQQAKQCFLCSLIHDQKDVVVGEGNIKTASIYVLGQDPGAQEIIYGRPFCGRSGELLRKAMADAGINEDETYITNMNLHRSKDNKGFPLKQRRLCWGKFGKYSLRKSNATIIVTVGSKATETIYKEYNLGWVSFSKAISLPTVAEIEGSLRIVIPSIHPAYALRGGGINSQRYHDLVAQLKQALAFKSSSQDLSVIDCREGFSDGSSLQAVEY